MMAEENKNLSVKVYYLDASGNYLHHFRLENEGYQAKDGETTVAKPSDLKEPTRLVSGAWQGATDEEHEAWVKAENTQHPELAQQQGPSKQDQALNTLGLQIAEMQKTQATTAQAINALGLKLAAQDNTTATK